MSKRKQKASLLSSWPDSLTRNKRLLRVVLAVGLFVVLYTMMMMTILPPRFSLEVGEACPEAIYAPRSFTDLVATEKAREQAAQEVPEVFDYNPIVLEEALAGVVDVFDRLAQVQRLPEVEEEDKVAMLRSEYDYGLTASLWRELLALEPQALRELQARMEKALTDVLEQGVKPTGIETARRQLTQEINIYPYSPEVKQAVEKIALTHVQPNMIFNAAATAENREAARMAVEPVRIPEGTLLIDRGERVTEEHLALLEPLNLLRGADLDYSGFIGLFLLLFVLFIVMAIYLFVYERDVYSNPGLLLLIGLIIIVTLVLSIAANFFSGFLIPTAMGVILITVLFDARLAILVNIIMASIVGLVTGMDYGYMLVSLLGGLVGIYSVVRVNQRHDLAKAGLYVAAINVFTILALFLISGDLRLEFGYLRGLGIGIFAGIGNGLFSAVMAIGLLPFLESGFGLTTSVTLLELSNPNHTLLRRLLMEAPGTYHHSIIVGNLAEAAAESVKADPLLARVGAFYHDIGKIKRPYFFVENQFSGESPHKKISPNLSALIISAHVRDGLELARSKGMPQIICDIIQQHHGTSMISFFYQKALEDDRNEKLLEDDFRYEGPLPQTKEAAIIMLADAVEAAVRSLSKPLAGRIEGMVRKLIKEKLNDGQLDECDLTLKDLDKIGDTFVHILSGIFHTRIEYPEKELKAEFKGA